MTTPDIQSFDDLTKIAIWQEFVWKGDLYRAICAPKTETRNGFDRAFIRANRRNFAMPSGWECADVMESRETDPKDTETDASDTDCAMALLQDALNALDPSVLTQIAEHLERFRDMATKDAQDYGFAAVKHVIQSDRYDTVRSLATYCRVAINAQTGKTAVKEGN